MSAPRLGRAKRNTLQSQVYRQLRRGLMSGLFPPGSILTYRSLAALLGTSAMPVREAVNRLAAERALEVWPNRSVVVPRMTRSRFLEVCELRCMLEGYAAARAAATATDKLIVQLRDLSNAAKRSAAGDDTAATLNRNQEFHFAIYRAADTEILLPMIEMLWLQAGPLLHVSLRASPMHWNWAAHDEILDAFVRRDAAEARRAMMQDIRNTEQHIISCADFAGEAPSANGRNSSAEADRVQAAG